MASARKRKRVPDYGRPRRRELGFAQYVSNHKQSKKTNSHNGIA
ncbi:hypothetical protein NIES267_49300 [Calothrix parasitica NIES-267]|uniref:Uncharacterized protein n=1 Tax=Calothrix parasitica NIES-267 TaxID=1973488 RepID=A0A1Z4LW50_9CYAN|nr:hypothetical protein NIES267_49300 [Calothrix parasitica NIES-267]